MKLGAMQLCFQFLFLNTSKMDVIKMTRVGFQFNIILHVGTGYTIPHLSFQISFPFLFFCLFVLIKDKISCH